MDFYYDKLIELNADGVDFVPFCEAFLTGDYKRCEIVESFTKDELKHSKAIPKTPYLFWKYVDGNKVYCKGWVE